VDDEIQLISDGDGLAVIGQQEAVDRFLAAQGLESPKDLGLPRLSPLLGTGAAALQAGSGIAANSGRWVKLTKESARVIEKHGLMTNSKTGLSMGVVQAKGGQIKEIVQFAGKPGTLLGNPAVLAGAAGLMAQLAVQHEMSEIRDYLATIDKKVDDVLRAQKNAELARVIGAGLDIMSALAVRDQTGRVDEITWSTVQGRTHTVSDALGWALLGLSALAGQVESKAKVGELAETAREVESEVGDWLAVLARCFELQDALDLLRLDRVLDASPGDLDGHRLALSVDRQNRRERVSESTGHLMARIESAARTANAKVLLHPGAPRAVVHSRNQVAAAVAEFHGRLGIEDGRQSLEARRWTSAISELKDKALETGTEGVDAARRFGDETADRARSATDDFTIRMADRALRRREEAGERGEES
jgi:hypothetical protein